VILALLPITFNDGREVWDWSKTAWIALALPATFLFFHSLINEDANVESLAQQRDVAILFAICVTFLVLSLVVWLYFRRQNAIQVQA
jgi:hypothetical protein